MTLAARPSSKANQPLNCLAAVFGEWHSSNGAASHRRTIYLPTRSGSKPRTEKYSLAARIGFACLLTVAFSAHAATERIAATIERTMTTDGERFGGCMVALSRELADFGLNCPGRWVTFSCTGVHSPKDHASAMFVSAQSAFLNDLAVYVHVTDEKKHNGHCYANRIDVRKAPTRSSGVSQGGTSRRIPTISATGATR